MFVPDGGLGHSVRFGPMDVYLVNCFSWTGIATWSPKLVRRAAFGKVLVLLGEGPDAV